jgi:hypothetical protein
MNNFQEWNTDRANSAQIALNAFAAAEGENPDDESLLCDLLSNLKHYADRAGIDFEREFELADIHYNEEKRNKE